MFPHRRFPSQYDAIKPNCQQRSIIKFQFSIIRIVNPKTVSKYPKTQSVRQLNNVKVSAKWVLTEMKRAVLSSDGEHSSSPITCKALLFAVFHKQSAIESTLLVTATAVQLPVPYLYYLRFQQYHIDTHFTSKLLQ